MATIQPDPAPHDPTVLADQIDELQRRIVSLQSELDRIRPDAGASAPTSRRNVLRLAGASAVGVIGGVAASSRPVAAQAGDPVLQALPNPVDDTTTLDGTFPGPVLSLFNRSEATTARALYAYTEGASPAVRADNNGTVDAVGLAGNAPAGVDVLAAGSGRIAMADHAYGGGNEYGAGELHQSGGTVFAVVADGVRRVVAAPAAAGALFPIDPIRVYDSRLLTPLFGPISAGQRRSIAIDDARDAASGAVVQAGAVPADATAIAFNLTLVNTRDRGWLSVTPDAVDDPPSSTVNWWTDDLVLANSSIVGVGSGQMVSVSCGGSGSTDFVVDVVGYYR